jgi:hypothetical protein
MVKPAFVPAAAAPIKGRFNKPDVTLDRDALLKTMSPQRAAGPQFYPMMARQRAGLLDLAYEEARDFMRHQDPSLLPPLLEIHAQAGRAIGYDPDIVIPAGKEIITPKGELFRPDTTVNISTHALQLWQVARLVPQVSYAGAMEVDDIGLMPEAEELRIIMRNMSESGKSSSYEIAAVIPAAKTPDAISLADEFAHTSSPAQPVAVEPQAAQAGDTAYRLMTAWMIEEMANQRPHKKFPLRNGMSPYMRVVPLFPGLALNRVKHPTALYRAMGVSLNVS